MPESFDPHQNPNWLKDRLLGDLAVKKAFHIFRNHGLNPSTESATGFDLLLRGAPTGLSKVEVKFDVVMDSSGNLGAEWWSDKEAGSPGWLQYSDADVLVDFYDMDNAHVLYMKDLQRWVQTQLQLDPQKFQVGRSRYSNAELYLIPCGMIPRALRVPEWEPWFRLDYQISSDELDRIRNPAWARR